MMGARNVVTTHPIQGVTVRADAGAAVETVSANAKSTELRVVHGVVNVSVHHPENTGALILVDLPGGQTAILKDGLYTFNAETNVMRVLKGEADAYPGAAENGLRVKEDEQFGFAGGNRAAVRSQQDLMADYLPGNPQTGDGPARRGYGPYGDGFYGYPAYGYYGYPYGFYPYGYGLGFGFGYGYGGFGGFRGGFRGRFR
jgi:hypothetical protein